MLLLAVREVTFPVSPTTHLVVMERSGAYYPLFSSGRPHTDSAFYICLAREKVIEENDWGT